MTQSTLPPEALSARPIPGPRGLPLVGVAPQFLRNPLGFTLGMLQQYGATISLPLGPRNLIMVAHPEGLRRVLQENVRNYVKNYGSIEELLGKGLVTSNGEEWLRQRRLMQPAFHHRQIAGMVDVMKQEIGRMRERWQEIAARNGTLDLSHEMLQLTQAIILRTMFSAEPGDDADRIGKAFTTVLEYSEARNYRPKWMPGWTYAKAEQQYKEAVAFLEQRVYAMIAERRREGSDRGDLLDMLLNVVDAETGERMSDKQIRDEVMTIYFAGHETTASALAWTCVMLARHPDVAERLRAEYAAVLGGRDPEGSDIGQLPYNRMVLDEVLRLYPSGWLVTRRLVQDDQLNGYHIAAGTTIAISPFATHHLAEFWPDPQRFDPERHSPERAAGRHKFAYIPFILGPRKCIGDTFALTEMQLALPMLFQHFAVSEVAGSEVQPKAKGTLRVQEPALMQLRSV